MNLHRHLRQLLAALAVLLLATAVGASAASAASPYGELTRFGQWSKQSEKKSKPTEFGFLAGQERAYPDEQNYAIGVDPDEENAVFALDEPVKPIEHTVTVKGEEEVEFEHHLRIQRFTFNSAKKAYEATASVSFAITSPQIEEENLEAEQVSNIAVDAKRGVLYVLVEQPRKYTHTQDKEAGVATTLYAFKTKASGKELVPAAGAEAGGVLVSAAKFGAESEEPGKPLIDPRGITVDPSTGEVIILAHVDESHSEEDDIASPSDHYALQRVEDNGILGKRYVDTDRFFQTKARHAEESPSSPVVTEGKQVLVQFEGIAEIPYNFEDTAEPKQLYLENEHVNATLEPFVSPNEAGGALSLSPEGTLYEPVSVRNEGAPQSQGPGGVALREAASLTNSTGGLLGWTGGQSPAVNSKTYACVLEPGPLKEPLYVAAGSGGDVFVLGPEYLTENETEHQLFAAEDKAIIELGPGATGAGGCPTAADSGTINVSENGITLTEKEPVVTAGDALELYTTLKQADALTDEWTIKDETTHEAPVVEKPNPLTFNTEMVQGEAFDLLQQPNLGYTFTSGGDYKIDVKVHGDNLDTPEELAPKEELKLTVDQAAVVIKSPESESAVEGGAATFTAEGAGFPTPTVQWEFLSTAKGAKWVNVPGATSAMLTIKPASISENGYKYRARFENEVAGTPEKAITKEATLTVTGSAQAPTVTHQPASVAVTEPASASFTAEASGSPTPSVQWEVSTNGGVTFAADTSDPGNNTPTLKVENTNTSDSGREYRAVFTNTAGSKASNPATLTVNAKAVEKTPETTKTPEETATTGVLHNIEVKPPPVPIATLASTSLTVSAKGAVVIKVTCPAGETSCIGTVTLRTLTAVVAGAGAYDAKAKKAILTLASGSFSVAGGGKQTVTLHLSTTARKLLSRSHTLRAKATLVAHDLAGAKHTQEQVVTLRLAKH